MNAIEILNNKLNSLVCWQGIKLEDVALITMDRNANDILISLVSDDNNYGSMLTVDSSGKYIIVFRGVKVRINPAMKLNSIQIDYMEGGFNSSDLLTGIKYGE